MVAPITIVSVNKENISDLEMILLCVIPISYPPTFFKGILQGKITARLAYLNGKAVGCGAWRNEDEGLHLMVLGVKVLHRRRGIGSTLMKEYLNEKTDASESRYFLYVQESNSTAIELYTKFGFAQTDRIANCYPGLEEPDAIKMTRMAT